MYPGRNRWRFRVIVICARFIFVYFRRCHRLRRRRGVCWLITTTLTAAAATLSVTVTIIARTTTFKPTKIPTRNPTKSLSIYIRSAAKEAWILLAAGFPGKWQSRNFAGFEGEVKIEGAECAAGERPHSAEFTELELYETVKLQLQQHLEFGSRGGRREEGLHSCS